MLARARRCAPPRARWTGVRFVLRCDIDENLLIHAEADKRREAARAWRGVENEHQPSSLAVGVGHYASSASSAKEEERQEEEDVEELKPRATGRSAAVSVAIADAGQSGGLRAIKGPSRGMRKGPYFGADGWQISKLSQAIHYLNSPTTAWPAERAFVYVKSLELYAEIHKLRGRKDQAAARSVSTQAGRAEAAEEEVSFVRKELSKLERVAQMALEDAKEARKEAKAAVAAAGQKAKEAAERAVSKVRTELQEVQEQLRSFIDDKVSASERPKGD